VAVSTVGSPDHSAGGLSRRAKLPNPLLGETRSQTLADMVEGSLLLNFNNAKRRLEKEAGF
jgi:hypothetical protein